MYNVLTLSHCSDRFRSRMTEIAGGVCQAVTECGGWFDFGTGGRGGMSEVLKDGLKAHWAAKSHLAGAKDDTVVIAVRMLESTEFHEHLESTAVDLTLPGGGANPEAATSRLRRRVNYPSVDHHLFPEKDGGAKEQMLADASGAAADQDLTGFEDIEEGDEEGGDENKVEAFGAGVGTSSPARHAGSATIASHQSSRSKVDALHAEVSDAHADSSALNPGLLPAGTHTLPSIYSCPLRLHSSHPPRAPSR